MQQGNKYKIPYEVHHYPTFDAKLYKYKYILYMHPT